MSNPLTGEQVALLQQDYLKRLVESDEMFNDIRVLSEDEGNIESEMDIALGIVTSTNDKVGACVILRQPNGDDEMPGIQFPPLNVDWEFMCLEWREANRDTERNGTGKRAWHLARRIHRLVKAHRAPGLLQCITIKKPAIARSSFLREIMNGVATPIVGYTVRISCNEADTTTYRKVALPSLSGNPSLTPGPVQTGSAGTVITVTALAAGTWIAGTSIYYTSDRTNPCLQNPNATLYENPITVAAGTYMFRAFNNDGTGNNIGSDTVTVDIS